MKQEFDKVYITYFYNVRFFPSNMLPVSTAMYDPKWFHDFKGEKYGFKDKRGVLNGLKIKELSPYKINESDVCKADCNKDTTTCAFLREYAQYLDSIDFEQITDRLNFLAKEAKKYTGEEKMDICLLVHEKPDNPCSERGPILEYFRKNGIEVKEYIHEKKGK